MKRYLRGAALQCGVRRTYYDHEEPWQRICSTGGRGWDDLHPGAASDSYEALLGFLDSPLCPSPGPGTTALDLGCGGGQASILLAQRGFDVTGVDYSPTAVGLAKSNAAAAGVAVDFAVADCLDLGSLCADTFALVVDNHVLHCIIGGDRVRFLNQAARVLRMGGVFYSETMSAEGGLDYAALGVDPRTRIDQHCTRFWVRQRELLDELAAAGLSPIEVRTRPQPDRPSPGDTLVTVSQKQG